MNKHYFSHDFHARADNKLALVQMKMGLEGIGLYWCVIEMLHENNGNIPLSEVEAIAYQLRIDNQKFIMLIDSFGLFQKDDVCFWSDSVNRRIGERNAISEKNRENIKNYWEKKKAGNTTVIRPNNVPITDDLPKKYERNTIKVNKNKEEETKEEIKNNADFDKFWDLYQKKTDREKSIKAWAKLTPDEILKIFLAVSLYVKKTPDPTYRKNPLTWINGKCWNDEMPTIPNSQQAQQKYIPTPLDRD